MVSLKLFHDISGEKNRIITNFSGNAKEDLRYIKGSEIDDDSLYTSLLDGNSNASIIYNDTKALAQTLLILWYAYNTYKEAKIFSGYNFSKKSYVQAKKKLQNCKKNRKRYFWSTSTLKRGFCGAKYSSVVNLAKVTLVGSTTALLIIWPVLITKKIITDIATGNSIKAALLQVVAVVMATEIPALLQAFADCKSTYLLKPYEFMNLALGRAYIGLGEDTKYKFIPKDSTKQIFSENDIPYFYHCNPSWDPITDKRDIPPDDPRYGSTIGYRGNDARMCNNDFVKEATDMMESEHLIDAIHVLHDPCFSNCDKGKIQIKNTKAIHVKKGKNIVDLYDDSIGVQYEGEDDNSNLLSTMQIKNTKSKSILQASRW